MNKKEKIKLLNEVEDLIIELKGIDGGELHLIGISIHEYENPTWETVDKLKKYLTTTQEKKEVKTYYGR
ncbi:MAG: hypothetical protein PHF21_02520 [Bacilli bacterium]|nr:hypothetical protein [Bacilli bacterium]